MKLLSLCLPISAKYLPNGHRHRWNSVVRDVQLCEHQLDVLPGGGHAKRPRRAAVCFGMRISMFLAAYHSCLYQDDGWLNCFVFCKLSGTVRPAWPEEQENAVWNISRIITVWVALHSTLVKSNIGLLQILLLQIFCRLASTQGMVRDSSNMKELHTGWSITATRRWPGGGWDYCS